MPTLPRSTCARACEGLSRRQIPRLSGLGGHEQHGALDHGHDADAAAQHLRARVQEFAPGCEALPRTAWRWIVETVPTLPRSIPRARLGFVPEAIPCMRRHGTMQRREGQRVTLIRTRRTGKHEVGLALLPEVAIVPGCQQIEAKQRRHALTAPGTAGGQSACSCTAAAEPGRARGRAQACMASPIAASARPGPR